VVTFTVFELRRNLRDSRFLLFLVAMPPLLYLLYSGFAGPGTIDGLPAGESFMVSMCCYAAMGAAMYAIGPPLAAERATGWIRQLRVMPLTGPTWVAAKVIQGSVLIFPGVIAVAVTAAAVHHPHISAAQWAALAAVLLAGSLPFSTLGLVIGQALEGQAANSATLFVMLGLSFIGGLLIPDPRLPADIRHAAQIMPSHQLAAAARAPLSGQHIAYMTVLTLAVWTAASAAAALLLWRRDGAAA
jgi:ABC-2 type transport system permease protein